MKQILISACLLGLPVRYDGNSKIYNGVANLREKYILIPYCPEIYGGLPTPRDPAEIVNGRVISIKGKDVTREYTMGAKLALDLCNELNIDTAILKSKSPSCGKGKIYDGTFNGTLVEGHGITAKLLMESGINVYSEDDIYELL